MPVIKRTIKSIKNLDIDDNEINFYNHESSKNIIKYLNTYLNKIDNDEKILYFSFYGLKRDLMENYDNLNKKNIAIIDKDYLKIDVIEHYIIKEKPKYVFINYYNLILNTKNLLVMREKLGYVLDKINTYSEKYKVKFIVAINKEK